MLVDCVVLEDGPPKLVMFLILISLEYGVIFASEIYRTYWAQHELIFFKFLLISTFEFQDIAPKLCTYFQAKFKSKILYSQNEQIDGLARG